jgi:hypothetical protein
MKRLISSHKEAIAQHTDLDFDEIQRITYLHEFDRVVQYVSI